MYRDQNPVPFRIVAVALMLPLLALAGWRVGVEIAYERTIEGHLKRAADANSIELAERELETVLSAMEARGMTEGYTSVLYQTPQDDLGFWHDNLKTSLQELKALPADASPMEKSNMLLKLRETLLDHDRRGEGVTAPSGVAAYPHNKLFVGLLVLFVLMAIGGIFVYAIAGDVGLAGILASGVLGVTAFVIPLISTMF